MADHTEPASLRLAKAVTLAAKLREDSYDNEAAKACLNGDYSQFYRLSLFKACERADAGLAIPVYIMLDCGWNQSLTWAEARVKEG